MSSSAQTTFKDLSVASTTVEHLIIAIPFPGSSRGKPVGDAFPAVKHLQILENTTILCKPSSSGLADLASLLDPFGGFRMPGDPGVVKRETLQRILGVCLMSVETLTLNLVSPHQSALSDWKNAGKGLLLPHLCRIFPNLTTLNIGLSPTYTRDPKDACLLVSDVPDQ